MHVRLARLANAMDPSNHLLLSGHIRLRLDDDDVARRRERESRRVALRRQEQCLHGRHTYKVGEFAMGVAALTKASRMYTIHRASRGEELEKGLVAGENDRLGRGHVACLTGRLA